LISEAHAWVPSLARARSEGVRALARRWWQGGEAIDLLAAEPDETIHLAAWIVASPSTNEVHVPAACRPIAGEIVTLLSGADPPRCLRASSPPPYREPGWRTPSTAATWEWPLVHLRYRELGSAREVTLIVAPDGTHRAIVAPPR
jgi:hypothetical protein